MTRPPERPLASPRVSIVTPSLNQGRFLRYAIESVLAQSYDRVEYLVVDGGSTDETLEVLRSYGDRVRWISEKDHGQSDAINKGFRRTRGEVIGWLNADDVLQPGAIERGVRELEEHPSVALVYGRGCLLDDAGVETGPFAGIEPFNLWRLLYGLDYILQPATFFRRDAFEAIGGLDANLHYAMDWDLWIRLAAVADVRFVDQVLAGSREYGETKTATGGWKRIAELRRLVARHTGRGGSPGVKLYALDTLRLQLRTALPPLASLFDSLVAFVSRRIMLRAPVQADGWLGPRSSLVVPRRWVAFEADLEAHGLPAGGRFTLRLQGEDGRETTREIDRLGITPVEMPIPAGSSPFAEIRVASDFSFRSPPDPRRLSVRCVGLRAAASRG